MLYQFSVKKMPGKRKFAQVSNEDQKSDDLSSTSEKRSI